MKKIGNKERNDDLPPLYDVEEVQVERRLNAHDRRAAEALRKAAKRRKTRKELALERRRHPGRRATDLAFQIKKRT
jgi:hypothetical protein